MIRVLHWFASLWSVIGLENSPHPLDQSDHLIFRRTEGGGGTVVTESPKGWDH